MPSVLLYSWEEERPMHAEYLLIGQVLRPQGIRGQVKVRPDTDDPARFQALDTVYLKEGADYKPVRVDEVSVRDGDVFLRLDGAETRDQAEKQRNLMLYIDRAHAVQLEENESFICDLIGCEVRDTKGNVLGTVIDVLQPGGNDVYVVKTPKGEMLLPALLHIIPSVHTKEGYITVDESRLHEAAVCDWET